MSIAAEVAGFVKTRKPSRLIRALTLILRQGRVTEVVYGLWCFLFHKPSAVGPAQFDVESHYPDLERQLAELRTAKADAAAALPTGTDGERLYCTDHGMVLTADGFIFGEYGEFSARVFTQVGSQLITYDFYNKINRLRHIHSVFKDGERVYISTGDTHKFLDEWVYQDGHLNFVRRCLRKFGGFTTCAKLGQRTFFGTDFSHRPNYLYCLEGGQKWFFPTPAYTQYCYLMFVLEERYLICFNRHLSPFGGALSVSVFDAETERFVACQRYPGGVFETDHNRQAS